MATILNADTVVGGAIVTGDASGVLALQAGGNTGLTLNSSRAVGVGASPDFGSSGQLLQSNGSSAAPTWTTLSTAPTTAQVLTATAGLTFGAVGSYAFLGQNASATILEPGDTQPGSELRFVGIGGGQAPGNVGVTNLKGSTANIPTGSWRCLGYAGGGNFYYTLFLRIS